MGPELRHHRLRPAAHVGPAWRSGPIPYGFDVDDERRLVPSARPVPGLACTEAESAAEIIRRIAAGATPTEEARRLNALAVPAPRRYLGQGEPTLLGPWRASRLKKMARHRVYRGLLVDEETWGRAAAGVEPRIRYGKRRDPLRGLMVCAECGARWRARLEPPRLDGTRRRVYVCGVQNVPGGYPGRTCAARAIPADWLERAIADRVGVGDTAELASAVERVEIRQATTDARLRADVVVVPRVGEAVSVTYRYWRRAPRSRTSGEGTH